MGESPAMARTTMTLRADWKAIQGEWMPTTSLMKAHEGTSIRWDFWFADQCQQCRHDKKKRKSYILYTPPICLTSFRDGNKSKTESEEHTCSCFLTWSQFAKGRPPSFQSLEAIHTRVKKHQATLHRSSDGPCWNHPVKTPAKSLISRFNRGQTMKLPAWIQWPRLSTTSPD